MRTPLPRIAIAGTCDSSGNATITNQIVAPPSQWALIYVPVQVSSGSPAWAVQLGASATAAPLVFGSGQQAMLGPFLLLPGEYAALTVTGADASAVVTGQALGWQATDPEELLGSTPITTAIVSIAPVSISGAVSILGTPTVALSQPAFMELVGASGALLGDPTGAVLSPDQAIEPITTNSSPSNRSALAIASFKPATTIAQVGVLGAVALGSAGSVSPAFGQATTAGNLLVAWVGASGTADVTTVAAGWVKHVSSFSASSETAAIWYRPNCGNAEAAPVFTCTGAGQPMVARLAEFSGAATVAPNDQNGTANDSGGAKSITAVAGGTDGQFKDLVLSASRWITGASGGGFPGTVFNNSGVTVDAGTSQGGGQRPTHFAYTILPAARATAPLLVQPNKKTSYTAVFRLAARPYAISNTFAAAGRKQYATIYHPNTATKTVKLRHCLVAIESASAAAIVMADLIRLTAATTPATGNPAITPTPANPGDSAAEATTLSLPTTAGTEGALWNTAEWNLGVTGAASLVNPPPSLVYVDLVEQTGAEQDEEFKIPAMRSATAEGWAVTIDCNAAGPVIKGYVVMFFTEE